MSNRSIQLTKEFVSGFLTSKGLLREVPTRNDKIENKKINKSQISGPLNTTFTTSLNNSHFQ